MSSTKITNTQQLVLFLQEAEKAGIDRVVFRVGKNTGYGPAVLGALRRRGFLVSHLPGGAYELRRAKPTDSTAV